MFPSIQGKALHPLVAALHPLPLLCLLVEGQVYQETAFVLHQVCVFLFVHLYFCICIPVFVFLYLCFCIYLDVSPGKRELFADKVKIWLVWFVFWK